MTGLISGDPVDSQTLQALGSDNVPASTGQVLGAELGGAFMSNPSVRLLREGGNMINNGMATDDLGRPIPMDQPPQLSPDEANQKYGIKGVLSFDKPVSENSASDLFDLKHTQMMRQDTIDRRMPGLMTSAPIRLGADFAAGLLDPLNVAAAFIPVVGEARYASMLEGAGGALGRAGVRTLVGGAQGAAGQAALEPLNFLQATQEHEDFTAAQVLRDVAFGTVLGGGLHVAGGFVGDRLSGPADAAVGQRMEALGPEAREATLGGAVAQTVEGRPVDIAPAVDFMEAQQARQKLQAWRGEQDRVSADADAMQAARAGYAAPDLGEEMSAASDRLAQNRESAEQLRAELDQARAATAQSAMDPETAQRLDDVNTELAGVIPRARRASLESERAMLLDGRGSLDINASSDMDVARGQAQSAGISAALQRAEAAAADSEAELARIRETDAANQAQAEQQRASADRSERIQQAALDSRQQVAQALAERSVRQFAGRIGVTLEPDEAASVAREIMGAQPAEVADTIDNALSGIAKRSARPDVQDAVAGMRQPPDGIATLGTEAQGAANDMAESARRSPVDPDDAAAGQRAEEARAKASPAADATRLTDQQSDLDQFVQSARDAGALDATDEAHLAQADEWVGWGNDMAKAYQETAACLLRGNG